MLNLELLNSLTATPYQSFTFPSFRSRLQQLGMSQIAIGASENGYPVGLVLAELSSDLKIAEILSIYVVPTARQRGIGTALLASLEATLVKQGYLEAQVVFMTGKPSVAALKRMLERANWTVPQTRMIICKSTIDRITAAPWMSQNRLPSSFTVFSWQDLTDADREILHQEQRSPSWVPSDLLPLHQEQENLEMLNSLGVRHEGSLVGWVLTHRLDADTIRYTCSFIRADLQRRGRIIPLYVEAIRRQAAAGIAKGIWTVPLRHTAMFNFVQNRMAPYMTSIEETKGVTKQLIQI